MFPIKVFYIQYSYGKELAFALDRQVPHGPLPTLARHLAKELSKRAPATARQCAKDPGITASLIDFTHPLEITTNDRPRMTFGVPADIQKSFLGALQKVLEENGRK